VVTDSLTEVRGYQNGHTSFLEPNAVGPLQKNSCLYIWGKLGCEFVLAEVFDEQGFALKMPKKSVKNG
jgi:hypothetical protein